MASSPRIDELKKKFDENPRRYFAPLANEYRKFGDLEQAIQLCRAYLPQQPGHMSGHIVFGQALFEAGQLDEAKGVFETALGLDPENLIALRHLGDIARAGGDIVVARQWYQRVLDADPRNDEIAAQIATIDATPQVAPGSTSATSTGDQSGAAGWSDINPETAKAAPATASGVTAQAPAQPAARPDVVDLESIELRDSMSMPAIKPGVKAPSTASQPSAAQPVAPPATTEPEFERDGEGAFALPNPDAAVRPDIGVERSEEIDLRPASTGELTEALFGAPQAHAEHIPPPAHAEHTPPPAKAPLERKNDQSFGPSNEFGFEVMEFVPPVRDSDPTPVQGVPVQSEQGRMGFGVPFTGETNAKDETPAAFMTETMAELYLQQGFTQEALGVYRQLLAQNPRDEALRDRIAALEKGSRSSVGAGAVSDKVFDEVQRRHHKEPETIRAFFGALMRRRVLQRYDDSARAGHTRPETPNGSGWVAEANDRVDRSRDAYGTFTATETEHTSSELAFIVPAGAAPPPGMAPGDDHRAEYQDDATNLSENVVAPPPRASRASGPSQAAIAANEQATDAPWSSSRRENRAPEAESPPSAREYAPAAAEPPIEAYAPDAARTDAAVGNITDLFGDMNVGGGDEQAAKVLSGAFPVVEGKSLAGRPAERAKNELSLDNVFREADRKTGRTSGSFSFDQFFSDGSGGAKPTQRTTDPSGTAVGGPDLAPDDDVAQFNDWLTGLKKK